MHPTPRALVVMRRWHRQLVERWLAGLRREEATRLQHLAFRAWDGMPELIDNSDEDIDSSGDSHPAVSAMPSFSSLRREEATRLQYVAFIAWLHFLVPSLSSNSSTDSNMPALVSSSDTD